MAQDDSSETSPQAIPFRLLALTQCPEARARRLQQAPLDRHVRAPLSGTHQRQSNTRGPPGLILIIALKRVDTANGKCRELGRDLQSSTANANTSASKTQGRSFASLSNDMRPQRARMTNEAGAHALAYACTRFRFISKLDSCGAIMAPQGMSSLL